MRVLAPPMRLAVGMLIGCYISSDDRPPARWAHEKIFAHSDVPNRRTVDDNVHDMF